MSIRNGLFGQICPVIPTFLHLANSACIPLEFPRIRPAAAAGGALRGGRDDLDEERERSKTAVQALRDYLDEAVGYINFSTGWAHTVILMSAEHVWRPPLLRWMSLEQWRKGRHEGASGITC